MGFFSSITDMFTHPDMTTVCSTLNAQFATLGQSDVQFKPDPNNPDGIMAANQETQDAIAAMKNDPAAMQDPIVQKLMSRVTVTPGTSTADGTTTVDLTGVTTAELNAVTKELPTVVQQVQHDATAIDPSDPIGSIMKDVEQTPAGQNLMQHLEQLAENFIKSIDQCVEGELHSPTPSPTVAPPQTGHTGPGA